MHFPTYVTFQVQVLMHLTFVNGNYVNCVHLLVPFWRKHKVLLFFSSGVIVALKCHVLYNMHFQQKNVTFVSHVAYGKTLFVHLKNLLPWKALKLAVSCPSDEQNFAFSNYYFFLTSNALEDFTAFLFPFPWDFDYWPFLKRHPISKSRHLD